MKAMLQLQAGGNAEPTWKVKNSLICVTPLPLALTLALDVLMLDMKALGFKSKPRCLVWLFRVFFLSTKLFFQVLVYDKTGQDIIGPLLSVKELRELGVTLHLLLHSPRSVFSSIEEHFSFPF